MQHVVLDQWSRGTSVIHGWDARLKLLSLLIFLVSASFVREPGRLVAHGLLVLLLVAAARLPLAGLLGRLVLFLPIPLTLATMTYLAGDSTRAVLVLAKSCVSASAVLVVTATTPLPRLLSALEALGVPRALVMTIQMVWRYLFVVVETGIRMVQAAACRLGEAPRRQALAAVGTGVFTALFARSHARASGVQQAMAARGYTGAFPALATPVLRAADWTLTALAAVSSAAAVAL